MNKNFIHFGLAAILLTGCATTNADGQKMGLLGDPGSGVAIAMTEALPHEGTTEIKTASSGDKILEQEFSVINAARVNETINENTLPLFGKKYEISPETILYPVLTQKFGVMYCVRDVKNASIVGALLTGETDNRGCLRDMDDDSNFDQLWGTDEATANATYSSVWVQKASGVDLETPVPYEVIDATDLPKDTLVINYSVQNPLFASKSILFSVGALNEKNKVVQTTLGAHSLKVKELTLPKTVAIDGAQIEILQYDDETETITYRVETAFPEGKPVVLVSQRAPIVIYY